MRRLLLICAPLGLALACLAQDIHVPTTAVAGEDAVISTAGSGKATFYLLGPGVSRKTDVSQGEEIHVPAKDLQNAGIYVALVCSDTCRSTNFYVSPAKPANLTFLVHPSRVPVAHSDVVSGVAFPFDHFHNLVLAPVTVNFQLNTGNTSLFSHQSATQNGVAWFRTGSGKSAGLLQVVASVDDLSARRAVQQVASDPCNLRIKGARSAKGILIETEPVHDCAGNVVPDGTIVTFTAMESNGRSTVDAPIKQGVARAQIEASSSAVISVASGVVMGNELRIGGKP